CVRREMLLPVRDRHRTRLSGPLLDPGDRPGCLCGGMPHDPAVRPRRGPSAQLPAPRPSDPPPEAMTRPGSSLCLGSFTRRRGRAMTVTARFLRRDPAEVEPWAETCGQIRPLIEERDGAAAEVHH